MMRVLIVDDEAPVRRLLRTWVEGEGATTCEAGSAEEGLALVEAQGAPAVALCDIRMPGNSGLWLAGQLRARHPETAVVMTTGVLQFDAAVTSIQAGVVDYLVKPFTRGRMIEALSRAFYAHKSKGALVEMQKELDVRRGQVSEALCELELNTSTSLEAMLAILRVRDAATYEHGYRVAHLAVNLAMALQIGEPQLSDIERGALLHDLGRLALSADLLSRPEASLSESDRARLCAYPLLGHAMLKNVPHLAAASAIAVAVHERCDGSGFPHGLRGEEIPMGARIAAVADAYDVLVSGTGAPPVNATRAIDILCTGRSEEFDPLVLHALQMLQPGERRQPTADQRSAASFK